MNKITYLLQRYWDMLLRERVYVFYSPPGRDPWSLGAIPSRRSAEQHVTDADGERTKTVQADCTFTGQTGEAAEFATAPTTVQDEFEPPRNAA